MPHTLSLSEDYDKAKDQAKKVILSGGILIYPTDTLYGLGCNALSEKAIAKIYAIKKRDEGKPLSIIVADYSMLREYCEVSPEQERVLHALLPGPYTFILRLKKRLPVSPTQEIGIRVPEHIFARQASKELGVPIVATSANLSGKKDASEVKEIGKEVSGAVDLLVDGGKCQYGTGSTVIDLIQMKVLRKGAMRQGDKIEFG